MFCTNCGIEFDDGAKVCPNCLKSKWSKLGEIDPNTANEQVKDSKIYWQIAGPILIICIAMQLFAFYYDGFAKGLLLGIPHWSIGIVLYLVLHIWRKAKQKDNQDALVCSRCGELVSCDYKFCTVCGESISTSTQNTLSRRKQPLEKDSHHVGASWDKPVLGIIAFILAIVVSFVPMMDLEEEVLVMKQVAEEYTTVEPYIVEKEVEKPYTEYKTKYLWPGRDIPSSESIQEYKVPVVRYSTDIEEVTEYREVTKTRLVERPVIETKTKRVSILRYWLD